MLSRAAYSSWSDTDIADTHAGRISTSTTGDGEPSNGTEYHHASNNSGNGNGNKSTTISITITVTIATS